MKVTQTGAQVQADFNKIEDIDLATTEKEGLMSAEDKAKLDGIEDEIPTKLSDLEQDAEHRLVTDAEKQTWNNKSDFDGRYDSLVGRPYIPQRTSDLRNDSGFITNVVNNLVNYYLKSEVYTKAEVAALIASIQGFSVKVVDVLPTASEETMRAIYLVPSAEPQTGNTKDEWITVEDNGAYRWEQIGSTAISLDGYVTDAELTAALQDYVTSAALATVLAGKQDVIGDLSEIRAGAQAGASAYQKPEEGIPATDLSEAVQASLEKADGALQEETDPTVPAWAKAANPPTEVFVAEYGVTTYAEVTAAVADGKICVAYRNNRIYYLDTSYFIESVWFISVLGGEVYRLRCTQQNNWSNDTVNLQQSSYRVSSWQSTPDNNHYPAEKLVKDSLDAKADINALGKYGVVSQTQTWTGSNATGYDYTMSNQVYGLIPQANIDLFVSAGVVFNETTGYFELNGLTDISYIEMLVIYNKQITSIYQQSRYLTDERIRTTLQVMGGANYSNGGSGFQLGNSFNSSRIEVIKLNNNSNTILGIGIAPASMGTTFRSAKYLKAILTPIRIDNPYMNNDFTECYSLETIYIATRGAKSLAFPNSSKLSLESVVYMVDNSAPTSAVSITLHQSAYARCQADTTQYTYNGQTYTGILAYASAKNITIASA